MSMTGFLVARESVREFKNKKLTSETLDLIDSIIRSLEGEIGADKQVNFKLVRDGKSVYEGFKDLGGYAGVMIESPHYIALQTSYSKESEIYGAYYMEKLVTELEELNLGTCWVTVKGVEVEDKARVLGEDFEQSQFLLAVGYKKPKSPFAREQFSERKEIQDIVYTNNFTERVDLDQLEMRGILDLFYYIRFAPSTKNLQAWRFLIKDNKLTLYMTKEFVDKYGVTDAGIVMYYYEELAKMINLEKKWDLLDFQEEEGLIKIAETSL